MTSFCKYCRDLLSIEKNIEYNEDNILCLEKNDLLDMMDNDTMDYNNNDFIYKLNFHESELDSITNDKEQLKKLKHLYNDLAHMNENADQFACVCKTCGKKFRLIPGSIVDTLTVKHSEMITDEEPKIRKHDNTCFRTKNYICTNLKCITNTDKSEKVQRAKEAIFYKLGSVHNVNYVCTICDAHWKT